MFKIVKNNLLELLVTSDADAIKDLTKIFNSKGYELYLVGGCVRDLLLGKEPKDIDLCTSATPDEMKEIIKDTYFKSWDSGIKHGTLTITCNFPYHCSFEVTTFRVDGSYEDHRRPDEVKLVRSLEEDLKRRDLTINSFAYDSNTEEIIMLEESFYYDLKFGIIRTVGNAKERFTEDALRMLRAIRFSAQLGFSLSSDTYNSICELGNTIKYVSKERIRDELTKILMSDYPMMIQLIRTTNLDTYIGLPLESMLNNKQHNKYHYTDVFHHTMDVVKSVPKDFELRWAAFFHDFGKILTASTDSEGWEHYYGHPDKSAEMAIDFMTEYKFDNTSIDHIYKLVKYHDSAIGVDVSKKVVKKLVNNIGEDLMEKFFKLTFADRMAHIIDNRKFSIDNLSSGKDKYINIITNVEPMKIRDLKVNGNDLKDLGLEGKEIGIMLNLCLDYVLENPECNNKETLINFINLKRKEEK